MKCVPVERYPDFSQEYFLVLASKRLFRDILDFLQEITASHTWLRVISRKGGIVVSWFEINLLLLCKLCREPCDNR